VNGTLTLGENIADVAGLATAWDAYALSREGTPGETLEGFTPTQRFFLGWAQAWRSKAREPALRNSILTNVHAPGRYRALTVRNLDPWYPAFDVQPGQALYLAPDERVKVWWGGTSRQLERRQEPATRSTRREHSRNVLS